MGRHQSEHGQCDYDDFGDEIPTLFDLLLSIIT